MAQPGPRVFIAVPNTGTVNAATIRSLGALVQEAKVAATTVRYLTCAPVELTRQLLVREFLSDPSLTHLLFVDSDMGPQSQTLNRLLRLKAPIACAPCPIVAPRLPTAGVSGPSLTTNIWQLASGAQAESKDQIVRYLDPDEFPKKPFECHGTGLACCLIQREVFERMSLPYFAMTFGDDFASLRIGEDAFFFNKARELGYRITVDPALWCEHYKEIDVTHLEDFFRDDPIRWRWNEGNTPKRHEGVFVAALSTRAECHAELSRYLANETRKPDRSADVFDASHFAECLRDAIDYFLKERTERYLFLLDDRTVPPDDFLDRFLANPSRLASGLFREPGPGGPIWGLWAVREVVSVTGGRKAGAGARGGGRGKKDEASGTGSITLSRLESLERSVYEGTAMPPDVVAASLRATIVDRDLLSNLGTEWIGSAPAPEYAGANLAKAARNQDGTELGVIPIGCRHFEQSPLGVLLQVKTRLKEQLREQRGG